MGEDFSIATTAHLYTCTYSISLYCTIASTCVLVKVTNYLSSTADTMSEGLTMPCLMIYLPSMHVLYTYQCTCT